MSNLDLWNSVEKTDIKFTKHVNQKGGYTNIDAYYQLKNATKIFGIYGKGFGLCKSEFDTSIIETGMIIHKAVFFYVLNGERFEFPLSNATTMMIGTKPDVDFAKKIETNTVGKALSKLGFNADVYMGKFEDSEYLHERASELVIENAADKDEAKANQIKALYEDTNKTIEQIKTATTLSMVEGLFKAMFRRIGDKDKSLKIALTKAKDEAKERLTND